jgi:hypothetical protein
MGASNETATADYAWITGQPEVNPWPEVLVLYLKRPRVKIYRSDAL